MIGVARKVKGARSMTWRDHTGKLVYSYLLCFLGWRGVLVLRFCPNGACNVVFGRSVGGEAEGRLV